MKIIPALSAIAAVVTLSTASAVADGPVRMTGLVLDNGNSAPLAGATVIITDDAGLTLQTRTDRNGQYAALGLESGNYLVRVIAPGFYEGDSACRVQSGQTALTEFRAYRGDVASAQISYRCKIELPPTDRSFLD